MSDCSFGLYFLAVFFLGGGGGEVNTLLDASVESKPPLFPKGRKRYSVHLTSLFISAFVCISLEQACSCHVTANPF